MRKDTIFFFFFFNDTATTEIYTLSLHDALPICRERHVHAVLACVFEQVLDQLVRVFGAFTVDRKSTRLNSSHVRISYAVFCLKKKKKRMCKSTYDIMNNSSHSQTDTPLLP